MQIDWQIVATIAAPITTLVGGIAINRFFESRPMLISYYSHVGAFTSRPDQGQPFKVNTHSVVLKNDGRRPATNVRLRHNVLPDFDIWPRITYSVEELPGGGREIVIPTLVPNEQITVSYLYFPPTTVDQINSGIKCDQGFAKGIPVLLQRRFPAWFNNAAFVFMLVGIVSVIYLFYLGVISLFK